MVIVLALLLAGPALAQDRPALFRPEMARSACWARADAMIRADGGEAAPERQLDLTREGDGWRVEGDLAARLPQGPARARVSCLVSGAGVMVETTLRRLPD